MEKYNGWLVSESIVKRSLAVWWHFMLGYVIIILTVWLFAVVIGWIITLFNNL
jgi:hypothetical protein